LPELAADVDARLQSEFISAHGGLLATVMQGGRPRAMLSAKLHEFSRQAIQHVLAGVNVLDEAGRENSGRTRSDLRSSLTLAMPTVLEFGGTRRVLAVLPRDSSVEVDAAAFSHALGTNLTAIAGEDNSLTLCVEADQLSLRHLAVEFVQRRRDRVEFAERVHCRTDITWTPLVPLSSAAAPIDWGSNSDGGSNQTLTRQDMCKTLVM
jgi:hypothetical protein